MVRVRQWMKAISASQDASRNMIAFLFGMAGTLTLPPFSVFPLVIIAYGGLFLLVSRAPSPKRAFADGWWWGWGYYITGLYWFCIALATDMASFGWMIPFALFGVTAFVALYPALASLLFYFLPARGTIRRILIFSIVWTVFEYARGHLLTGFPWNIPGNSFAFSDTAIQLASLFGAYGLSFWAVLLGSCVAALSDESISYDRSVGFILLVWLAFMGGMAYGEQRLKMADAIPEAERYVPDVMLRLVQPNISQPNKWEPAQQMQVLQTLIRLTQSSGLSRVSHVIWPESAIPYIVRPGTPLLHMLGSTVPDDTLLITGALRMEGGKQNWQIWNSLLLLDHNGTVLGKYDKSQLVPFGEFLPLRQWIPEALLTPVGAKDFSRGQGSGINLGLDGLPTVRPMICYEAIFPEWGRVQEGTAVGDKRPQWFLNITNDAWFGRSTGPYQHFNMARMRAAEYGIPLVRVANTGISAVIDPYGRVESKLPLGHKGILDVKLPKPTADTLYGRYNNLFFNLLIVVALVLVVI